MKKSGRIFFTWAIAGFWANSSVARASAPSLELQISNFKHQTANRLLIGNFIALSNVPTANKAVNFGALRYTAKLEAEALELLSS